MILRRNWLLPLLAVVAAVLVVVGAAPAPASDSFPIRKFSLKPLAVTVGTQWTATATVGRQKGLRVLLQRSRFEDWKFATVQRARTARGGKVSFTVASPQLGRWFWRLYVPAQRGNYQEVSFSRRVDVADSFPKRLTGTYTMAQVFTGDSRLDASGAVTFVYDGAQTDDKNVVYAVESLGITWQVSGTGTCPYEGGATLTDPLLAHGRLTVPRAKVGQSWVWTSRIGLEFSFPSPFIATRTCDARTGDFGEMFGYVQGMGLLNLGDVSDPGGVQQVTTDLSRITGSHQYSNGETGYSWSLDLTGEELAPR